jgi:hypothetical protein
MIRIDESHDRYRRLPRARRERPRSRSADERDEFAASDRGNHSITSSAVASRVAGTSRPSAFAVPSHAPVQPGERFSPKDYAEDRSSTPPLSPTAT